MCKYCSDAFIDIAQEDGNYSPIAQTIKRGMFGNDVIFSATINEHGQIEVGAYADDYNRLLTKRIRFCPMCGAKIPRITPTDRHKRG